VAICGTAAELEGVTLENGMRLDRVRLKWRPQALYGGYIDEARIEKDGLVARGGMQILADAVRFWGTVADWSVRAKLGRQIQVEASAKRLRGGISDLALRAHGEGKRGLLDALSLKISGEKWRALGPAKLRVVDGGLAVRGLILAKGEERIRIDAAGDRRHVIADASVVTKNQSPIGELPIAADLHGEADLRSGKLQVDGTLETRALDGKIAGTLVVRGTVDHPEPEARLHGDGLKVDFGGEKLPVDARMRIHDGVIDFEQVKLVKDKSLVLASGSAPLDGSSLVALIDAHRMPLQHGQMAAFLDGELLLRMRRDASGKLRGEFSVERGEAKMGTLAVDRDLQEIGPLEDVKFAQEKKNETFVLATANGFSAKLSGPFRVHGPDIEVDLQGSVRVDDGLLRGRIGSKPGGWIDVYGHRYELERVNLNFDDSSVDIQLKRGRPDAIVYIDLRGPLDRAKVTLRADPPIYDQTQLAALVVNGDAGAARSDDRQELAGALSSVILGRLKSQLAPQLPIDVFKLDSDRVEAGKLFGERLYLAYVHNNTNAPHTNHDQAQAELRLPRGLRLETSYGDVGGSLDLSWLKRF
jgi:hypothetical protein